jgi:uncharacterized protein (DUF3084 family)
MTATFFEYLGWVSLSPNLKESFNKTLLDAEQHRHSTVGIEHLLYALVDDPEGAIALTKMGIDRDALRNDIADHLDAIPAGAQLGLDELQPARELKKLMARASDQADHEHDEHIDGGDVIQALAGFETSNTPDFLIPLQNSKNAPPSPKHHTRSSSHKTKRSQTLSTLSENSPVENSRDNDLNFDVDPIKTAIKAIMARRRDAEEVLYECEWYHLFKSLNMIDEGLEGEEQAHRAKLLARAEQELAERPRCRKAFLYVRHLDQELTRLKGIVDIDWAGDISPDEAVSELSRLRSMPQEEKAELASLNLQADGNHHGTINKHLFDIKIQESEVLALEQKLLRLDKTAGISQNRLKELENHLETHDTHSKKRENVIGELERYLRSEMQMADARDQRIDELEKELLNSRNISDSQISKASHLEQELIAFKEHAGNREKHISKLEARLKEEKDSAGSRKEQIDELHEMLAQEKKRAKEHDKQARILQKTYEEERQRAANREQQVHDLENSLKKEKETAQSHEEQVRELREMLAQEKSRAEEHNRQIAELQKTYEEEKQRAARQEQQVHTLEADLKSRLEQLQAHEKHIKNLQKTLSDKESDVLARDQQLKKLESELNLHQKKGRQYKEELQALETSHKAEVEVLVTNVQDHEVKVQKLAVDIQEREKQVKKLISSIEERKKEVREREAKVQELTKSAHEHEAKVQELTKSAHEREAKVQELTTSIHEREAELQKLVTDIQAQKGESRISQLEISTLRAQLAKLETRLQDQEASYSVEKLTLTQTIDQMRREIEEAESLVEIIHAVGEPYRIGSKLNNTKKAQLKIGHRRTIPIPAKPRKR